MKKFLTLCFLTGAMTLSALPAYSQKQAPTNESVAPEHNDEKMAKWKSAGTNLILLVILILGGMTTAVIMINNKKGKS